jgi:hypothetical protein
MGEIYILFARQVEINTRDLEDRQLYKDFARALRVSYGWGQCPTSPLA